MWGFQPARAQWASCAPSLGPGFSFAVSGNTIFAGCDGGIFFSADSGKTWASKGLGAVAPIYSAATNGTIVYAGTQSGELKMYDEGKNFRTVTKYISCYHYP